MNTLQRIIGIVAITTSLLWLLLGCGGIAFFGWMWSVDALLTPLRDAVDDSWIPGLHELLQKPLQGLSKTLSYVRIPGLAFSLLLCVSQVPSLYIGWSMLNGGLGYGISTVPASKTRTRGGSTAPPVRSPPSRR
jgi:hypothetical protein